MAINNINAVREILDSPVEAPAGTFTFTPISEETILTGIVSVIVGLDDANNELEVELDFVGDAPKASFLANTKAYIKINDIVFPSSLFIDLGAGLNAGATIALGVEAEAQADYNTFTATQSIEIAY